MCIGTSLGPHLQTNLKSYSRKELFEIGDRIKTVKHEFKKETFSEIQNLKIGKHRGKRAGKKLLVKNKIEVISQQGGTKKPGSGVNVTNLIKVECKDLCEYRANSLKFGLINSRSICNKVDLLPDIIQDEKLDILTICETWLNSDNEFIIDQIRPNDFTAIHTNRKDKRGGGVAVICRSDLKPKQQDSTEYSSFEHIIVSTQSKQQKVTLATIYRPPDSKLTSFLHEFDTLLASLNTRKEPILVNGDFNIHAQKHDDRIVRQFLDILAQYDLTQHVQNPTHVSGNTIDLIITRKNDAIVKQTAISTLVSDHFLVTTTLAMSKTQSTPIIAEFRKLKSIDVDAFKQEIAEKLNSGPTDTNLDNIISFFDSSVRTVLDSHAPYQKRKGKQKPLQPWYDEEIHFAIRQRRSLERKWKKHPSPNLLEHLKSKTIKVNEIISKKKNGIQPEKSERKCEKHQRIIQIRRLASQ